MTGFVWESKWGAARLEVLPNGVGNIKMLGRGRQYEWMPISISTFLQVNMTGGGLVRESAVLCFPFYSCPASSTNTYSWSALYTHTTSTSITYPWSVTYPLSPWNLRTASGITRPFSTMANDSHKRESSKLCHQSRFVKMRLCHHLQQYRFTTECFHW